MLTSFFKKSKPANFLAIGLTAIIFYVIYNISGVKQPLQWDFALKKAGMLFIFLLFIFFINFILVKEKYKTRHTYVLFLATLCCIALPASLINNDVLMAGFLSIVGLRRTMALQTGRHIPKKVFDATFCFVLASLFVPAAFFFNLLPLIGVFYYGYDNYKNWLIPGIALLCVFILKTAYNLLISNRFFHPLTYYSFHTINFEAILHPAFLGPALLMVLFSIWAFFNTLAASNKMTQIEKKALSLLLFSFLVSTVIILFPGPGSHPANQDLLFLIIPTSLIGGRYFDISNQKLLFHEILLSVFAVVCIGFGIVFNWHLW